MFFNMASRMYFLIMIFSTVYSILGDNYPNITSQSACYGKELSPKECYSNDRYLIHDLKFGAKSITKKCPIIKILNKQPPSCCSYSPEDCFAQMPYKKSFYFYNDISGHHNIKEGYQDFKASWTRIAPGCQPGNNREYTNYVFISTECVHDENILNMDSNCTSSGRKLYIMFRGDKQNMQNDYDNYTCAARAKLGGLIVYSVDVRLQDYNPDNNNEGMCNNSHEVVIKDINTVMSIKCENYTILGYNQTYLHSRTGPVLMTLYIGTAAKTVPQMVWLAIEADGDNDNIEVNCNGRTYTTTTVPVTHTITSNPPKVSESIDSGSTVHKKPGRSVVDRTTFLGVAVGGVVVVSVIFSSIIYVKRRNARSRNKEQTKIETGNQTQFGKQPFGRQNNMRTNQTENVRRGNVPGYRVENHCRHDIPDAQRDIQADNCHENCRRNDRNRDGHRDDMEMNSPVYVDINEMKRHRAGRN